MYHGPSPDQVGQETPLDREIMRPSDPRVLFITDHCRDHPRILVRLSTLDDATLPGLLGRAWRLVAPKSLVARYDTNAAPESGAAD
jgi:hypothetical protein